ncbi:hypothetical protein IAR50_001337 [Cryptococcus sp. DSM 104548]
MIAAAKLIDLLPALALLGMALTGLENAPTALAVPQSREHHRHLAARLVDNVAKQDKKRSAGAKKTLRRRSDGTICKAKSTASSTFTDVVSSTASGSATAAADLQVAAVNTESSSAADVSFTDSASSTQAASSTSSSNSAQSTDVTGSLVSVSTSGSKFGLAWPNGNWAESTSPDYIGNYVGTKTTWYYTWSPFSVGSADSLNVEFVPMYWGVSQQSDWWAQQSSWPSTVKNALFFNEPNQSGQGDISAADSVQYWMNDYLPLRSSKGTRLGHAATTSAATGLQWVQDFKTACTQDGNSDADCTSDFTPIHWYDTTAENFQSYVENFHNSVGQNLWVTEYACQNFNGGAQCTDQEIWNLHTEMAAWFDQQDYVERYSPFGVMEDMQGVQQYNALMNPDGSITSLGAWYIANS